MNIARAQELINKLNIDGWLLYNFQNQNSIAKRIMDLPKDLVWSRRYFYFIPAKGEPKKLVCRIEHKNLDCLPGEKTIFLSWQSLREGLESILDGASHIAMEYSPDNAIPYVARVDGGTIDLVKSLGKEVVSSGNLIQEFEAALNDEQIESHFKAAKLLRQFMTNAFDEIRTRINKAGQIKENTVQHFLTKRFHEHNLIFHDPPLVAVNENAGNPHYLPTDNETDIITNDDLVLIDISGKLNIKGSVFADITWVGYTGENIPGEYIQAFSVLTHARDAAVNFLRERFGTNQTVMGFEVDDIARKVLWDADYGEMFIHRTGHSLGEEAHGNGANLDNLETHDNRTIIPRTCFSVEPGIYTETFGLRTEINVMIMPDNEVKVSTEGPQKEILVI